MKYFLEEIGKGWISKKWFDKMFSKQPHVDYEDYSIPNPAGIGSVIYTGLGNPLTTDPSDALMFDDEISASDGHTFLRHNLWYSTPTLEITEHEFI